MKSLAPGMGGTTFRGVAAGLCLLALVPMTGCATLIFPERSLVPPPQRGGVDGILLTADIVASVPFTAAGCIMFLAILFDPPKLSTLNCRFFEFFYLPISIDLNHGTLFLPKEGAAPPRGSER